MSQNLQGKGASDSQSRAGEVGGGGHGHMPPFRKSVPPAPAHKVSGTLGLEMLLEF